MPARSQRLQYGSRHTFQFGPLLNSGLFSSHWLEHRLGLEPEWRELKEAAKECLSKLCALWRVQRTRVALYGDEDTLKRSFIDPVLGLLGWKLKPEPLLQGREPDYALFLDDAALDSALRAGRASPEFWNYPLVAGEAKAWDVRLDRPRTVNGKREYPPEQMEWYLNHSQLNFGILTNGRLWRLVPRNYEVYHRRFEAFLQADLAALLDGAIEGASDFTAAEWYFEEFVPFYLFFGPNGFSTARPRPLVQRAIEGSSEYRLGIGEDLRARAFDALTLCVSGFLHHPPNQLDPATDLEVCRENSLVFLYRLLFVMFAEDRGLLPYRTNHLYTDNRSLARHRDEVAGRLDRVQAAAGDYSRSETAIWEDLQGLFDLIDRGHARYGVAPYNGGLFDPDQRPFLSEKRVPDWWMARVIDHLSRAKDAQYPAVGLCRVDYRDLAIQHLGGVYEGLLEIHPRYASVPMMVVRERTRERLVERTVPVSGGIPAGFDLAGISYEAGAVYPETDKGERRASGSYYTPDHIVTHIVEQTLGPLCKAISDALQAEIARAEREVESADSRRPLGEGQGVRATDTIHKAEAEARLAVLKEDYGRRILQLRVLDPAMGSGHFLLRTCQFLAEDIATHPYSGEPAADGRPDESAVTYWKRRVVECCLYGVDLNPMAVELAELALWLETVAVGRPLTFLAHHVRAGNSLIGARIAELGVLPGEIELRGNELKRQLEEKLSLLLAPLAVIRASSSDGLDDVKSKDRLYRGLEKARAPFRDVADLWCSTFAQGEKALTEAQYQEVLEALGKPRRLAELAAMDWFLRAKQTAGGGALRPFHWELEFPEVFFVEGGRRPDAGFDAVLGNPPWGQKELALDQTMKSYLRDKYESLTGILDLFRPFVEKGITLLRPHGMFGMVLPDIVLLKDYADTRLFMLRNLALTHIRWWGMAFQDAVIDAATVVATKAEFAAGHSVHVIVDDPEQPMEHEIPQLDFLANRRYTFNLYLTREKRAVLAALDELPKLGDFFEAHEGIHSGNMRSELFVNSILDETCRPMYFGRDEIAPFRLLWKGRYVRLGVVPPKRNGKKYANVGQPAWHTSPKVLVRRTGDYVLAAVDQEGLYASNNFFVLLPKRECSLDLHGLCALLNSRFMTWYFRTIEPRTGRVFSELKIKHLNVFPLPAGVTRPGGCDQLNAIGSQCAAEVRKQQQPGIPFAREIAARATGKLGQTVDERVLSSMSLPSELAIFLNKQYLERM